MDQDKILEKLATLTEQGRWMASEVSMVRAEVKKLSAFKWQILGFAGCAAFIATLLVEAVKAGVR